VANEGELLVGMAEQQDPALGVLLDEARLVRIARVPLARLEGFGDQALVLRVREEPAVDVDDLSGDVLLSRTAPMRWLEFEGRRRLAHAARGNHAHQLFPTCF
jgi:hypothetical protein